ncbi:UNVERIFIED_CONTAM: hypothetical protein GTU68_064326 [Idotea baltica]|nr:hypothetical protein [Idotea baltica]
MKPEIHPEYRDVVFLDTQNGTSFITRSTIKTELAKVEISAASHPFYTGTMTIIDTAGRVERFEKRYGRRKQKAGDAPEAPAAEEAAAPAEEAPAEAPAAEEPVAEAPVEEAAADEEE